MAVARQALCLPNLPGYKPRFPLEDGDKRHYKKTTLTYLKGYAVDETPVRADVEVTVPSAIPGQQPTQHTGSARQPTGGGHIKPKWVENDKKVLRWYGYFKEAVPESPLENHRVRRLVLCHHLADDTTEVLEPRVPNSGLWQGCFIKRHRIAKADGTPLGPADVRVGANLELYGHVLRITDADAFTRAHLAALGIAPGPAETCPPDPFEERQAAAVQGRGRGAEPAAQSQAAANGVGKQGRLQAYILNSQKVLRFYAVWDDRTALYGDRRPFRLHHYLEDGTTELLEAHEPNSGRDRCPVFLQRCQLPKDPATVKQGKSLDRRLCFGVEDFRIGAFVHIYGRDFFLHDCDEFTRQWYQGNLDFAPEMLAPVDVREEVPRDRSRALPPYNGYGSLEDSAENCRRLVPQPPRKNASRLMNKGKIVLRFVAQLKSGRRAPAYDDDSERRFVVSFFMADDTISVFEHPTDGFPGGKFLERGSVPRPRGAQGEALTDKDLFVGARLSLYGHAFELVSADEYTLQFMENNRQEYKMADWEATLAVIKDGIQDGGKALRGTLAAAAQESHNGKKLSAERLRDALAAAGVALVLHQALSVHRRLAKGSSGGGAPVDALLQALQL